MEEGGKPEDLIINLEHQSSKVSRNKIKIINMYTVLASYFLSKPAISIVLTDVDSYNKSIKEYKAEDRLIHKQEYFYFTLDEIDEKMNNLREKHDLNLTLSDMESMDLAFLPIMVPKRMRKEITKELVILFHDLKIEDETLVPLISQVLNLMIYHFFTGDELIELKGMIEMGFKESSDKILDARTNEFNDLRKERDDALTTAQKANQERDDAISTAKHLTEAFDILKKQGKISEKDLISVGIIL